MGPAKIGIVADRREASFGAWRDVELTSVWSHYVDAIERAGGAPLIFPAIERYADSPREILDAVDGIVLSGGRDIDARSYGAEPDPRNESGNPMRDRVEFALAKAAVAEKLPVLGVCRGMQLLNVALGGTLVQHLPEVAGTEAHRTVAGKFSEHHVRLDPESLACAAAGVEGFVAWSHHHQGVDQVGEGLKVTGWSEEDELPEAIELPGKRFALGVIWHPEEDENSRVIAALVEAAGAQSRRQEASVAFVPPVGEESDTEGVR